MPWGETLVEQKVADFSTPYQFNGKELDAVTGLYNYGARYYDPGLSIWMGVDPLADRGPNWSPYNYTFNNPMRFRDPDGRWPIAPGTQWKIFKLQWKKFWTHSAGQHIKNNAGQTTSDFNALGKVEVIGSQRDVEAMQEIFLGNGPIVLELAASGNSKTPSNRSFEGPKNTPKKEQFGDLSRDEINSIQNVVDEANRPLEVVGSAAQGARRNPGSDLPVGKGPGTKSDIDYTTAGANRDNFIGLEEKLPSVDPKAPILRGNGDPSQGPVIRFEPGNKPVKINQE